MLSTAIYSYIPDIADENDGGSTVVVVSLVIEIEGDSTVHREEEKRKMEYRHT
jgi:hypothetical protein